MTLDREERERRDEKIRRYGWPGTNGEIYPWLREAHARIEELEEALHARRLRCEELEGPAFSLLSKQAAASFKGGFMKGSERAEGYRKAAIILRDLWRDATNDSGRKKQV